MKHDDEIPTLFGPFPETTRFHHGNMESWRDRHPGRYDVVSCQFALHYTRNLDKVMKTISWNLRPGGLFVCTIPCEDRVRHHLHVQQNNPLMRISPLDAHSYHFWLVGTIDCAEYIIPKRSLIDCGRRNGLVLLYDRPFRQILMPPSLSNAEAEVADFYRGLVFERRHAHTTLRVNEQKVCV